MADAVNVLRANTSQNLTTSTHSVGSREVDSKSTSSSAQQKDKNVRPRLKVGNHVSSVRYLRRPVQPHVGVLPMPKELLHQNTTMYAVLILTTRTTW